MRDRLTTCVGVGVLALFGGMTLYMLSLTGASETEWTRAAYLFAGFEAIAFAAAGYLFGRAAHREGAEERGRVLARAVRGMGAVKPGPAGGRADDLARLIEIADRLYPELEAPQIKQASRGLQPRDTT